MNRQRERSGRVLVVIPRIHHFHPYLVVPDGSVSHYRLGSGDAIVTICAVTVEIPGVLHIAAVEELSVANELNEHILCAARDVGKDERAR